jgi:hypothetical protein
VLLNERVDILEKVENRTALGIEKLWPLVCERYAMVVLLDTKGQHQYQQIGHSEVTHIMTFRSPLEISLGKNRFCWRGNHYEPLAPPRPINNRYVSLPVKQVIDSANKG